MRDVTMTTSTMVDDGCCSHHLGLDICLDEYNCCHDVLQARIIQGTGHLNFFDMCIYGRYDNMMFSFHLAPNYCVEVP